MESIRKKLKKKLVSFVLPISLLVSVAFGAVDSYSSEHKRNIDSNKKMIKIEKKVSEREQGFSYKMFHPQEAGVLVSYGKEIDVFGGCDDNYKFSSLSGRVGYNIEKLLDDLNINILIPSNIMVSKGKVDQLGEEAQNHAIKLKAEGLSISSITDELNKNYNAELKSSEVKSFLRRKSNQIFKEMKHDKHYQEKMIQTYQ